MKNILDAYQTLIDTMVDYAFFIVDAEGTVQAWNKGAQNITGYTPGEIIGKNFRILVPAADKDEQPGALMQQVNDKGTHSFECFRVKKDGSLFWADVTVTAIHGENNVTTGYSALIRDISEKQKQKEFNHCNLQALINNTHDVMWSVDTNYRLITANDPFNDIVIQMSGNAIRKGAYVLESQGFTSAQLSRFRSYYDRAFAGETFTIVEHNTHPFEFSSEMSFYPIMQDGKVTGTACHTHDITEQVLAEKKITHLNRLYTFLSQINKAIVYADDEETLFKEACRIAVETGRFKVAWIGLLDKANNTVSLAQQAGLSLYDQHLFINAPYKENGATGRLLETGSYYLSHNVAGEPGIAQWKAFLTARSIKSVIVIPLTRSGEIIATYNIYVQEANFFDEEEIRLLIEAAADISFALDAFEKDRLRSQAEENLKVNQFRLSRAQEIARIGNWQLDFQTGKANWSEELCRIYGVPLSDCLHSYESWVSFIHPEDLSHVLKTWEEHQHSLKNFTLYNRIIRRDGEIRYVQNYNHFEFNNNGDLACIYGVCHDITESKTTEKRLVDSELRLRHAQQIAHFGSWEFDFYSGVVLWSDEACSIYGLDPKYNEQSYSTWLSYIHPADLDHVIRLTKEAEAAHSNASFYHRIVTPDGVIKNIHSMAHYEFDAEGRPTGLFGVVHDITEELANITRLKLQNEQLEDIAWIQSHKVRGPLATILGLTQQFEYCDTEDEIRVVVQGILSTSEKLDLVIREIVNKTSPSPIQNARHAKVPYLHYLP